MDAARNRMQLDISKHLKSASKIKLPGGVVGKVSAVLIVLCFTLAGLAALSGNQWIIGGAIVLMVATVFTMLWRLINFADKNPQAALLEGAEFLSHQQLIMASKEDRRILVETQERTVAEEVTLSPESIKALDQADTEVKMLSPEAD